LKPPSFEYVAPVTIDGALAELARHGGEARPLGGGQSLVPLLNFRLAGPAVLVDLARIPGLTGIAIAPASIAIGAMTPTARLLDADMRAAAPLLAAAARLVGHPQIRSRGTVGGSVAHADPAAELPAAAVLTGATVRLASPSGHREVAAGDFFHDLFTTACEWDELVIGVTVPRLPAAAGWGFREFARRPGDFALAGAGVVLTLADEAVASVTIVAFGVGPVPIRVPAAEAALLGRTPTAGAVAEARAALAAAIAPGDSVHGSPAYRRRVAGVLLERAIGDALRRAGA
jgi:carbon-monoxide dehydrogenase medium subunit